MPIEDIQAPKAPADWQPSADQRATIANDPRLKGMGRDDLYAYFHKGGGNSFSGAFHERAKQTAPAASSGGFLGSVFGRVSNALKGGK